MKTLLFLKGCSRVAAGNYLNLKFYSNRNHSPTDAADAQQQTTSSGRDTGSRYPRTPRTHTGVASRFVRHTELWFGFGFGLVMADCVGFQAQIASVIELLANSAVAEICKLVDDGYAVLRSQMDLERQKSEKENRVLRQKLREMDVKMRSYERKMKRRNLREEIMHDAHFRPPKGKRVELTGVQTSGIRI